MRGLIGIGIIPTLLARLVRILRRIGIARPIWILLRIRRILRGLIIGCVVLSLPIRIVLILIVIGGDTCC